MLIISRRRGERITINQEIEIVVKEITRHGVKLGIAAPRSMSILRSEVQEAVEAANRDASASDGDLQVAAQAPQVGVNSLTKLGVKVQRPVEERQGPDTER
jgi:carbon storage regulator